MRSEFKTITLKNANQCCLFDMLRRKYGMEHNEHGLGWRNAWGNFATVFWDEAEQINKAIVYLDCETKMVH